MPDVFFTFKQPVSYSEEHGYKPIYDPVIDYSIPNNLSCRHYVHRFILVDAQRTILDKILFRHPKEEDELFWVELTVKNNNQTHDFIELLKSKPEVTLIETPKKYEF